MFHLKFNKQNDQFMDRKMYKLSLQIFAEFSGQIQPVTSNLYLNTPLQNMVRKGSVLSTWESNRSQDRPCNRAGTGVQGLFSMGHGALVNRMTFMASTKQYSPFESRTERHSASRMMLMISTFILFVNRVGTLNYPWTLLLFYPSYTSNDN